MKNKTNNFHSAKLPPLQEKEKEKDKYTTNAKQRFEKHQGNGDSNTYNNIQ